MKTTENTCWNMKISCNVSKFCMNKDMFLPYKNDAEAFVPLHHFITMYLFCL